MGALSEGSRLFPLAFAVALVAGACGDSAPGSNMHPDMTAPDFTFSVAPAPVRVVRGSSQPLNVTLMRTGGFADTVTVTVSGLPAAVTAAPLTIDAGSDAGTLVFDSTNAAVLGTSATVEITASAGALSHTLTVQLYVQGPHGSLDYSFNGTGYAIIPLGTAAVNDAAHGVAITPSGQIIVVGGGALNITSNTIAGAIALTADGQLDGTVFSAGKFIGSFTPGSNTNDHFFAVAVQPDGKIVAAGRAGSHLLLARFSSAGVLDNTFGVNGFVIEYSFDGAAYSLAVEPDGTIALGGYNASAATYMFVHYSTTGAIMGGLRPVPTSAQPGGIFRGVATRDDGKLLAVGPMGNAICMARYDLEDLLDSSFAGTSPGWVMARLGQNNSDHPGALVMAPDHSFYVASISSRGGYNDATVAHFLEGGTLDGGFNGVGWVGTPTNSAALDFDKPVALAWHPDGQVVLAYTLDNGGALQQDFAWARVTSDGLIASETKVVSTDFSGGGDFVGDVAVQPDGRIVVVGTVTANSRENFGVARYWP
jgi:uncharacterized delta-60 repeat protein